MTRPTMLAAPHALRHRSGRARERLGTVPGSLLGVSRPLLARPGRPKIALGPALARPGRVPNALPRVPETALDAQNQPRPIFHRFFVDFGLVFRGFRATFPACLLPVRCPSATCLLLGCCLFAACLLLVCCPFAACLLPVGCLVAVLVPEVAETTDKTHTLK